MHFPGMYFEFSQNKTATTHGRYYLAPQVKVPKIMNGHKNAYPVRFNGPFLARRSRGDERDVGEVILGSKVTECGGQIGLEIVPTKTKLIRGSHVC